MTLRGLCYRMQSFGVDAVAQRHRNKFLKHWDTMTNFLEENRQHIFFLFVFYVITIALFIERFVCKIFLTCMIFLAGNRMTSIYLQFTPSWPNTWT